MKKEDTTTRVVNLHNSKFDVYIGRDGPYGNPFVIGRDGTRSEVIEKHMAWLRGEIHAPHKENPPSFDDIRKNLTGKVLGCFCSPKPCHGDNYVKICNRENP